MRATIAVGTAVLLCGATLGQSTVTPKGPVFDNADVHASPKSINIGRPALAVFRNGRYENLRTTVLDLISAAYSMNAGKVVGGPNWLDFERFDMPIVRTIARNLHEPGHPVKSKRVSSLSRNSWN
jgi:hypothetical protein